MKCSRVMSVLCCVGFLVALGCGPDQPTPIPGATPMPTPTPQNNPSMTNSKTNSSSNSMTNSTTNPSLPVGLECESKADCDFSHVCDITREGGYCRPITCQTGCEGAGGKCVELLDYGEQCWALCADLDGAPRAGYRCESVDGVEVMIPDDASSEVFGHDALLTALSVRCDSDPGPNFDGQPTREFTFEVGPQDNGVVVVPHSLGSFIRPVALTLPSGQEIDLVEDYRHHNARYSDGSLLIGAGVYGSIGFNWAIQIPYAPQFDGLLQEGEYTLRLIGDEDTCFYSAPSQGTQKVDLNLYFTNVQGLSGVNAPFDEDFQAVLKRVEEIYAQQGIAFGEVRYLNVSREVATEFAIIRDLIAARKLMGWGRARSEDMRDNLSVDIFMVDSLVIQGGTLLGLSGGVPGPAGLHGSSSNGLIFNSSLIGTDNEMVAHIMAHEIGHYLGLRHTTEIVTDPEFERLVGLSDPLDDTEECPNVAQLAFDCPDAGNLMFPAAPQRANFVPDISDGQSFVLERNPLTY